jgi:hypothetical protein
LLTAEFLEKAIDSCKENRLSLVQVRGMIEWALELHAITKVQHIKLMNDVYFAINNTH